MHTGGCRIETQVRQSVEHLVQHDVEFHAGKVHPEAMMLAESEGEVAIRILAMDVEFVRIGPLVGVVVRGADVEQHRGTSRNGDVAQHLVACDPTADLYEWLLEPQ